MATDILAHPKTDEEIIAKVDEFRRIGINGSVNQYDRMRKAEDFVIGGERQWDPAIVQSARNKGKFTLTIPIIKPQIKQTAGSEIQNPQDFIIQNTTGGAATIARVLTALVKQVADSEQARYEKSQMFESGISSGQGCIGVFLDRVSDPLHANLTIQKLNEHHVMFDPNATSYDQNKPGSGGQFVIWDEPIPKEQLEAEFPDKKDELRARGTISTFGAIIGNISGIIDMLTGRRSTREQTSFGSENRSGEDTMAKARYWKTHTWWKEYKKCVHWYDNRESELDSMFLCRDDEIKAAKAITKENPEIFRIEEVDSFVMHHTITVQNTFLKNTIDELSGVQMFPIVNYWPSFVNGYKSGISEDLIGTQEEINWAHSQALNQVKQGLYPPIIVAEDATGSKADELRDQLGSGNRVVIDASQYGGKVEFTRQSEYPTVEVFTQQAMNNVKTITGRLDIPESNEKSLSGKAKLVDVQKTQQGSMSIFSNYNYTLSIFGNLIVEIIRKNDIFSDDEILATVDGDDLIDAELLDQAKQIVLAQIQENGGEILSQPEPINPIRARYAPPEMQAEMIEKFQEDVAIFQQFVEGVEAMAIPIARQLLIELIHNMKIGKYNTKITMSPMAETMRAIKAAQTFELQRLLLESADVGLDGEDLIDATDAPNKEQLKAGREKKLASLARSA